MCIRDRYGTTRNFLDYFNLKSLDQLPTLAEIRDLDAMEPELSFPEREGNKSGAPDPAAAVASLAVPSTETRQ